MSGSLSRREERPVAAKGRKLCERFIAPPFSVLDARQGYWRTRKNAWFALGVRGGVGRNKAMQAKGSWSGSVPHYYTEKNRIEQKIGRHLSCEEFEKQYLPEILKKRNSRLAYTEKGGPISIFDPVLSEIAYRWFCPPRGSILDPFAGESTKGIVAAYLGYKYTGIELRAQQIRANQRQAKKVGVRPKWIRGDAKDLDRLLPKGRRYDLVFTSPPYYDLEIYSKNKADASTFGSYKQFLTWYRNVFEQAVSRLLTNRFLVIKVGEIRNAYGIYRNFVGDTIDLFVDLGLHYYNEAILITPAGSLPIRVGQQFLGFRKLGKCHQNILVFYKGDVKTIREGFSGEIEVVGLP